MLINRIKNYFTKGHQRSIDAKKNILISFVNKGASICISFILVRLTINYVNPTNYGIWLTLSSIIGWFSFFDIGFGNGLRNRYAEAKAEKKYEKARIYVSTTYAVLTIVFVVVWIVFSIINQYVDWGGILNAPVMIRGELSRLVFIIISFFCLRLILKTVNTIIIADQKPALANFLDMLGQLLSLIVIFILTKTTKGSLIDLGFALGGAPVLILVVSSLVLFRKKYREFCPSINSVDFSYTKDIMGLGVKFFLIQIGAIVLFETTNVIISHVLGPEKVTVYGIAFKYFSVLNMSFIIVLAPFWSAFTDAYTTKDYVWMKNALKKLKIVWNLSVPAALLMLLLSNFIYKLWIGNAVVIPFYVSTLMVFLALVSMRFNLFVYLINGIGKIKLQLYINIIMSLAFIPMAYLGCEKFGIKGILVINIFVGLVYAVVGQVQINKIMANKATGIWNE